VFWLPTFWKCYYGRGASTGSVSHLIGSTSSERVNKAEQLNLKKHGHYVARTMGDCWEELKMLSTRVARKVANNSYFMSRDPFQVILSGDVPVAYVQGM